MTKLRRMGEAVALLVAGWASLATSVAQPAVEWVPSDGTWVCGNLFDGQTAVPQEIGIELHIGLRDFRAASSQVNSSAGQSKAERAMQALVLRDIETGNLVKCRFEVGESSTVAHPLEPLRADSHYELDASPVARNTVIQRLIPPMISFATRAGPQVTGLWLVEDTLMISFSEPMSKGTLSLAPDSVDLLWDANAGIESASADRNLASFVWDNEGMLFRVAPIPQVGELWVKVSRDVVGASGAPLDGDKDGNPGEMEDDFLQRVQVSQLPRCVTAADRPEPCVPNR